MSYTIAVALESSKNSILNFKPRIEPLSISFESACELPSSGIQLLVRLVRHFVRIPFEFFILKFLKTIILGEGWFTPKGSSRISWEL